MLQLWNLSTSMLAIIPNAKEKNKNGKPHLLDVLVNNYPFELDASLLSLCKLFDFPNCFCLKNNDCESFMSPLVLNKIPKRAGYIMDAMETRT